MPKSCLIFKWLRVFIALSLIVAIFSQNCLVPNDDDYIYSTDKTFEKQDKFEKFGAVLDVENSFIAVNTILPVVIDHQFSTYHKPPPYFHFLPSSYYCIRSPPFLS